MDAYFGNRIATKCFEKYNKLGKSGKPEYPKQWTLLSGFLIETKDDLEVVSLATGTKCIGSNSMSSTGTVVNDSHAEVLARRGFIRFLYEEVKKSLYLNSSRILKSFENKCALKEDIFVHMFTSQVPCGDASIIPMKEETEVECPPRKRQRVDVHRTGAKPLAWEPRQDSQEAGPNYHVRGAVRLKPGRGDPTLSVSCSDKIAKWINVGLQGALLSHFIEEPIRLRSFVIGGGGPFDEQIVYNALISRAGTTHLVPDIIQSCLVFQHSQYNNCNGKPNSTSIIWANVEDKYASDTKVELPLEISAEGKRLGTTSKTRDKGQLKISKREFLCNFLSLTDGNYTKCTYREIKDKAIRYQKLVNEFKMKMGSWSKKPAYEDFMLTDY